MTTFNAKRAVIAEVFGNIPVDPEDVNYVKFSIREAPLCHRPRDQLPSVPARQLLRTGVYR